MREAPADAGSDAAGIDEPVRFTIGSLLWATAVFATSLATFGGLGVVVAIVVMFLWWAVLRTVTRLLEFFVVCAVVLGLFALLAPAVSSAREAARASACQGHLKQFALALLNASDTDGRMPDATRTDAAGETLHSWRSAVLPYMEEQLLYESLVLDEPWDSPANAAATAGASPWGFECPSYAGGLPNPASYFAVVGERAAWRPGDPRSLDESEDFPDGATNTVLLVEADLGVSWAEPRDLGFDEAVRLLTSPVEPRQNGGHETDRGFFYLPRTFRNVVWCDGRTSRLRGSLPEPLARAILTADGGEEIDHDELSRFERPRLDVARCVAFAAFALVSLAPTPLLIGRIVGALRRPSGVAG